MTARAGTEVEAANLALVSHLGERPIAGLNDNNARARAVRIAFGAARDEVLQGHYWGFATGYAVPPEALAPTPAGWPGRFARRFALPEDCLQVRFVADSVANEWEVLSAAEPMGSIAEVKLLATNLTAPEVCYTRRIETVRLWSPKFLTAFAHKLAEKCAPALARSSAKADSEAAKSQNAVDDAAAIDSKEKSSRAMRRDTSWLRARRRGGARGWVA